MASGPRRISRVVLLDVGGRSVPRLYELLVALGMEVDVVDLGFSAGDAEVALEGASGLVVGWRMRASSEADRLAAHLIGMAEARGRPIVGICYGAQIANGLKGGSLEVMGSRLMGLNRVRVDGDDPAFSDLPPWARGMELRLYEARGRRIRRLAPGLRAIAWSDVLGIEAYRGDGMYGFLFHPELSGGVGVMIMRGTLRALGLS